MFVEQNERIYLAKYTAPIKRSVKKAGKISP